ncbi:MAG: DUF2334 domain-containing protein [Candidatus Reddybacter sp.]
MIHIALRFDDPSVSSDHILENNVIEICVRYGVKINFAVIPFKNIKDKRTPLNTLAAKHLIDAESKGHIEISQHGNAHTNFALENERPSEFIGRSIEEQTYLLNNGKEVLDSVFGKKNRGLVPPWNSFDKNTIQAAINNGFTFISGGWDHPDNQKNSAIKLLPRTSQIANTINDIKRNSIYSFASPIIVPVIHHYDFIENNSQNGKFDLDDFETMIKDITTLSNVRTTSLNSITKTLSANNLRFGHFIHKTLIDNTHWRLRTRLPSSFLFHNSLKTLL